MKNAPNAFDRDPMAIVSRCFITHDHMVSSERSIGDPTAVI